MLLLFLLSLITFEITFFPLLTFHSACTRRQWVSEHEIGASHRSSVCKFWFLSQTPTAGKIFEYIFWLPIPSLRILLTRDAIFAGYWFVFFMMHRRLQVTWNSLLRDVTPNAFIDSDDMLAQRLLGILKNKKKNRFVGYYRLRYFSQMRRITDTSVMSYQALGICFWYLSILEPFWYVNVHVILRPACAVEQKQMISVRYFNVKSKMVIYCGRTQCRKR